MRLTALILIADAYFTRHCNQDLEAKFDNLCVASEGFADRRNEVAHEVQFKLTIFSFFIPIALITIPVLPPYSARSSFYYLNLPTYIYTSKELNKFILNGGKLHADIRLFINKIFK